MKLGYQFLARNSGNVIRCGKLTGFGCEITARNRHTLSHVRRCQGSDEFSHCLDLNIPVLTGQALQIGIRHRFAFVEQMETGLLFHSLVRGFDTKSFGGKIKTDQLLKPFPFQALKQSHVQGGG